MHVFNEEIPVHELDFNILYDIDSMFSGLMAPE